MTTHTQVPSRKLRYTITVEFDVPLTQEICDPECKIECRAGCDNYFIKRFRQWVATGMQDTDGQFITVKIEKPPS